MAWKTQNDHIWSRNQSHSSILTLTGVRVDEQEDETVFEDEWWYREHPEYSHARVPQNGDENENKTPTPPPRDRFHTSVEPSEAEIGEPQVKEEAEEARVTISTEHLNQEVSTTDEERIAVEPVSKSEPMSTFPTLEEAEPLNPVQEVKTPPPLKSSSLHRMGLEEPPESSWIVVQRKKEINRGPIIGSPPPPRSTARPSAGVWPEENLPGYDPSSDNDTEVEPEDVPLTETPDRNGASLTPPVKGPRGRPPKKVPLPMENEHEPVDNIHPGNAIPLPPLQKVRVDMFNDLGRTTQLRSQYDAPLIVPAAVKEGLMLEYDEETLEGHIIRTTAEARPIVPNPFFPTWTTEERVAKGREGWDVLGFEPRGVIGCFKRSLEIPNNSYWFLADVSAKIPKRPTRINSTGSREDHWWDFVNLSNFLSDDQSAIGSLLNISLSTQEKNSNDQPSSIESSSPEDKVPPSSGKGGSTDTQSDQELRDLPEAHAE